MRKNIIFFLVSFVFVVFVPFFVCTGTVQSATEKTYIVNKVASVVSEDADIEAIKAQIVIEYTNAVRENIDFSKYQQVDCEKSLRQKIENAYDSVSHEIITYNGQAIVAAYHAVSNGNTNDPQDVWGESVPYLVSTTSEGDLIYSEREYTAAFTKEQIMKILQTENETDDVSVNYNKYGYVKSVTIMGKEIDTATFCKLFSLKSNTFTVEYISGNYIINGVGEGHGVGMSLYGADFLARQGYDYKDILNHYYNSCEIIKEGI